MTGTVAEIRRKNLLFLIEQYKTIANLNTVLGRDRKDATLSQIKNKVKINGTDSLRAMGASLARDIEDKLNLDRGWMDKLHEEILPLPEKAVPISSFKEICSIPIFEISAKDAEGQFNPILKGELKLPKMFLGSYIQSKEEKLESFISNDGSMLISIPPASIVVVDMSVKKYQGDGLYLFFNNGTAKFRKLSQLLDGSYHISSDINTEKFPSLDEKLEILGKVVSVWVKKNY